MHETLQAYNKAGNLISEYVFEQKTIHLKDLHYYVHTLKQETGLSLQMLHSASAEVLEKYNKDGFGSKAYAFNANSLSLAKQDFNILKSGKLSIRTVKGRVYIDGQYQAYKEIPYTNLYLWNSSTAGKSSFTISSNDNNKSAEIEETPKVRIVSVPANKVSAYSGAPHKRVVMAAAVLGIVIELVSMTVNHRSDDRLYAESIQASDSQIQAVNLSELMLNANNTDSQDAANRIEVFSRDNAEVSVKFMNYQDFNEAVVYGSEAEAPADPTIEGYDFSGWFADESLTREYDFNSAVTKDMTLFPKFTEHVYQHYDLRELPTYTFVSQVRPTVVRMGCESAALLMALKTSGHALGESYGQFLSELPMTSTDNPYLGFAGILYGNSAMTDAVMPNVIADWALDYGNARDISKQGEQVLKDALAAGHPVVVWTSIHFRSSSAIWYDSALPDDYKDPKTGYSVNWNGSTGSHWEYKTSNHVMTLLGYDEKQDSWLIGDPAEWLGPTYWVSNDMFMNSWNCYQGAVEVW